MNEFIENIRLYLADSTLDGFEFSAWLEDYLCDHYEDMLAKSPEVTEILNEELPEICAEMEPGCDDTEFREKLKAEFDRAMVHYNK